MIATGNHWNYKIRCALQHPWMVRWLTIGPDERGHEEAIFLSDGSGGNVKFPLTPVKGDRGNFGPSGGLVPTGWGVFP